MVLRLVFGITIALLLSVSHAIAMQGVQGQGSSHPRLSVSLTGPGAVYAWPLPEAGFSAAATAGTHRPLTRSLPEVNLSTQRWFTSYRPDIRPLLRPVPSGYPPLPPTPVPIFYRCDLLRT